MQHCLESIGLWLKLRNIRQLGPAGVEKLIGHFEKIEKVFLCSKDELLEAGCSLVLAENIEQAQCPDLAKIKRWLNQSSLNRIICWGDKEYPIALKESVGAPLLLYLKGDPQLLHQPQLAMVGSRNPTQLGRETTYEFAQALGDEGLTITSGMALGVDGIAHQAALDANNPTIAVIGTGIDRVYPTKHQALANRIAEQGLIVSEFDLETGVRSINFPKRNRIIAGLSLGVLVVEAAIKSGSLITAHYALEQGRDVFAVPGSIHNVLSKGCHALIKQGACLVESVSDVLEHYPSLQPKVEQFDLALQPDNLEGQSRYPRSEEARSLLQLIDFSVTSLDTIINRSKKPVAQVSPILLTLELDGWIAQCVGGFQRQK